MAKLLLGALTLFLFLGAATASTSWVYMEVADHTTCSSGGSAQWEAGHACSNVSDADWGTYGQAAGPDNASIYTANYTIPTYAVSAKWEVKANQSATNWTIPANCWDGPAADLYLKATSYWVGIADESSWACWDSGDADWSTTFPGIGGSNGKMYEEAIWWEVNDSVNGDCGGSFNTCDAGTPSGGVTAWTCYGLYGGSDASCTLATTPGTVSYTLTDVGGGVGGLFDGIGAPLMLILILLGVSVLVIGIMGSVGSVIKKQ